MPKYLISLTHGRTVPLDILMGLQDKLFLGPILKQQDFLTLIATSSRSSSCSQIFSNLSSTVPKIGVIFLYEGLVYVIGIGLSFHPFYHTQSTAEGFVFCATSLVFFCFVSEISRELLNGFVPDSHGRRVWSLALTNLKDKVKCQSSRSPGPKTAFSTHSAALCSLCFVKHL